MHRLQIHPPQFSHILYPVLFILLSASSCRSIPREVSTLKFSGIAWHVRQIGTNSGPAQPGNNYFSSVYGPGESVYVDKRGRLHLAIMQRHGTWYSAEVKSVVRASCGTYQFRVILPNDPPLDSKIAVAIFLYADNTREFDIELSTFLSQFDCSLLRCDSCMAKCDHCKIQYVRQPFCADQNWQRFPWPQSIRNTTHLIQWHCDGSVTFSSADSTDSATTTLSYTLPAHPDNIDSSGEYHLHLSIWIMDAGGPKQPNTPSQLKRQVVIFEPLALPTSMTNDTTNAE
jgi:hypothetical protein